MDKSLDKKELIQKISRSEFIIKKITNHKNGDTTIRIGKEGSVKKDTNKPGNNPEHFTIAPEWFTAFSNNLDKEFKNINKKFDDIHNKFKDIDKKFDDIHKKFDDIDKKFENIDKKFDNIENKFDNIEKKFENIEKKLDDHIRDFDIFKTKQEAFNQKLLECPTIAAEFKK
ncbi:MAG: hypothetical protein HRT98_02545 [Mycoplasmatales bacterium]|nr:hypothetical protein [Mycoplasmatales bacterium]